MHYILLKGSDDQSRVAVSQELKRLRKRVKELEEEIEEVKGQYDYECECNKQFVDCQKENEKLKQQLEIFKLSNEALQQDNLDLSYNKADLAYEYAQEMAENWKEGYEEEIAELKKKLEVANRTTKLACDYLVSVEGDKLFELCKDIYNDNDYLMVKINYFKEQAEKELKGEDNENI